MHRKHNISARLRCYAYDLVELADVQVLIYARVCCTRHIRRIKYMHM